jgi:hypothetical protein
LGVKQNNCEADAKLGTTRSGMPSPFRSPTATKSGSFCTPNENGDCKVPSPAPNSTATVQGRKLIAITSGFPSPLTSLTAAN